jgi:hypothetical protein
VGTHFGGKASVALEVSRDGKSASADVELDLAVRPAEIRMRLRSPDGRPLRSATIDGAPTEVLEGDTIRLPLGKAGRSVVTGNWG